MSVGKNPIGNMIIKVDLNTTGFNKSMTGLRRQLKSVNTELRANLSQFDRSERSVKKYQTHIDGLTKRHQVQEKAVEQARKEYEKMVEQYGEGSAKAEASAIKLNEQIALYQETGRELKGVTAEFKEFQKQQEVQSSNWYKAGSALDDFGSKLQALSGKMQSAGSNLTKYVTTPIAGLVSTVTGLGFKRAMDLEQVDFMLNNILKSESKAKDVMDKVTDLVTDTSFGLAEVADPVALMMANNAKQDNALLYANVGMELSAMKNDDQLLQQIAGVYQKALSSGKIDGTMINQFSDAGIDILSVLGNLWGIEKEDVRKRIQEDGLDIQNVLNELSNGILEGTNGLHGSTISAGGMIEKSGETLKGKWKNFWASISQVGERMVTEYGIFDNVKTLLDQGREFFRNSDDLLKPVFIGMATVLEKVVGSTMKLVEWFSKLDSNTKGMIGSMIGIAGVIGPILLGLSAVAGVVAKVSTNLGGLFKWIANKKVFGLFGKGATKGAKGVGFFGRIVTGLTNPLGIAITVVTLLTTAFIVAYNKSETFRNFIHKLGDKLKEVFGKIKDTIQPAIDAVVGFFNEIKEKIQQFINDEGEQIIEAFQNIGFVIAVVSSAIWTAVKWTFDKILKIVNFVMPAIELIIGMVWGSIKDLITGALNVIMGAVKIFSGLFTGDFSKMWEGVKQLFFGAIQAVWGYINLLLVGRILKIAGSFVKLFVGSIRGMWTKVSNVFSTTINKVFGFVKNGFTKIFNTVKNINTTIRTTISNIWQAILSRIKNIVLNLFNSIKNRFMNIFTNVRSITSNLRTELVNIWNTIKTRVTNIVSNLWNSVKNTFTRLKNGVDNLTSNARNGIVGQWNRIKTSVTNLANGMWNAVKKTFDRMVNGAKKLPSRIATGIKNSASKTSNAVKSMGNKMLSALEKPINGMIGGVNWVTDKLGVKKNIKKVNLPRFAKGTPPKGHKGGLAIVGEEGEELVKLPDGSSFLTPSGDTMIDLPKGTHVIPHKPTMNILKSGIPHFAKGTGLWESIKSGLSKVKEAVSDVWEYATNPSKLVTKITKDLGIGKIVGFAKDLASAGWSYVKTKPTNYIKGLFSQSGGGGKPAFGWQITSPYGYRTHPISGGRKLHGGVDFGAPMGTPIPSTTGGKVSFASSGWNGGFGNLVKVKQGIMEYFYAHMSKILVKAGQSVKKGDILGLVGSTGASTGAHLHYEARRNGVRIDPMKLKGFKTGGLIKKKQLAWLGEEGQEMVIPLSKNRRTDAMKLLALTGKMLGADDGEGGSLLPHQLPNVEQKGNSNNKELIKLLLEQNAYLRRSNELLVKLVNKDTDVYLDSDKVGKGVQKSVNKITDTQTKMQLQMAGYKV